MKSPIRIGLGCLLMLAGLPAFGMYRCGNVFQDQPCASGPEVRLSPSGRQAGSPAPAAPVAPAAAAATATTPAAAPAQSPANFAIACARVGEQAQRIMWKREAGATQEQQLAERIGAMSPSEQARTVADVYARRGTAPAVRAAIEADCVIERQKEADAAELLSRLRRQAGETAGAPPAAPPPTAAAAGAADPAPARSAKASTSTCASLRRSVDDANARLSQGGSARTMELLQRERRSAEASFRSGGCA